MLLLKNQKDKDILLKPKLKHKKKKKRPRKLPNKLKKRDLKLKKRREHWLKQKQNTSQSRKFNVYKK